MRTAGRPEAADIIVGNETLATLPVVELAERIAEAVRRPPERDPRLGESAACAGADPRIFYPDSDSPGETARLAKRAVAICIGCRGMEDCLFYALARNEKYGVWGGNTERRRRDLRRELGRIRTAGKN